MRLEIEQQDRKTLGIEQARAPQHREPVGMHAMQQHDRAGTRPPWHEPAAQRRARARHDRDGLCGKISGRGTDDRARGCGEEQADGDDAGNEKDGGDKDCAGGELKDPAGAPRVC